MRIKRILFPTDLSRLSNAALPLAAAMARERKAELLVLHVQEPPTAYALGEWGSGPLEPDPGWLQQVLNNIKPSDATIPCLHKLVIGNPAREIVLTAKNDDIDLIIMGTHGRTGLARMLMGSVAEKVVRRAICPVMTLKQPAAWSFEGNSSASSAQLPDARGKTILLAVDFSRTSDAAFLEATALARDWRAWLIIAHVEQPLAAYGGAEVLDSYVLDACSDALKKRLERIRPPEPEIPCTHRLTNGDPADEIVRIAGEEKADLIVMGTHGHTGVARVLLGSVAEKVVRQAPCPVLTLKIPRKRKRAGRVKLHVSVQRQSDIAPESD